MTTLETNEATGATEGALPITPDSPTASPFRFTAASSLSSSRQESLAAWHRNFLRTASTSLTDLLRLELELELDAIQVLTYAALIAERGDDNHAVLFRMQPQPGPWLLDLPVSLALLVVERLMGGVGELSEEKARDLTEVDQIIFQQFADTLLTGYARGWRPHADLKPEVIRQLRPIKQARTVGHQPDELLVRIGVRILFKETKSLFWIVIPMASVEDLLVRSGAADDSARDEAPAFMKNHKSPMGSVPVAVSIRWQGFQMTLREVESMAPGDVLMLDNKTCENAVLWLADRAKFSGRVTREPQKTTITITQPLE